MTSKMLNLIDQLSNKIGERFAGTPAEHEAAHAILGAFREFDPGAYLDEINFIGWAIDGWPSLTIGTGENLRKINCAPIAYSGATAPGGVSGTLKRWGKKILIAGLYEPPVYAVMQGERVIAQIMVAPSDDAIPLLNPDPIFVLPMIAVGRDDHALLDEACEQGWLVEVGIGSRSVPNARSYNVVARYRGNPGSERRGVVVAHYDSQLNTPGCYDNASGVGALLQLLQNVSEKGLPINLEFVAVAGEEIGMIGSRFHAQRARERGELPDIAYCLCLDQISAGEKFWVWASSAAQEAVDASVRTSLASFPAEYEISEPMPGTDMWPLHEMGVPGVMLMWWRLAEYHRPGDDYSKLERGKLEWTVDAALGVLRGLEEAFKGPQSKQ